MKDLIIHVGLPKTASSTIQDRWFHPLHRAGLINYFGKVKHWDGPLEDQFIQLYDYLILNNGDLSEKFELSDTVPNVVSHAALTYPEFRWTMDDDFDDEHLTDPYAFPELIFEAVDEIADDTTILINLRNQQQLINSVYAHHYEEFRDEIPTWEDHLEFVLDQEQTVYDFGSIVEEYAEYFGDDNIELLLFETFINDKQTYANELASVLGVESTRMLETIEVDAHLNEKGRTSGAYYKRNPRSQTLHQIITSNGAFMSAKDVIKNAIGEDRFQKAIDQLYYTKEYEVSRPTSEQEKRIRENFNRTNTELCDRFSLDRSEAKKYEYIT